MHCHSQSHPFSLYPFSWDQRVARKYLATKQYGEQIRRIVSCQSYARRYIVQQQRKLAYASAVSMQRIWRGFTAFVEYTLSRSDIITVQTLFRRKTALVLFEKRKCSLRILQCGIRRWLAICRVDQLRTQREELLRLEEMRRTLSAMKIQAAFRGHIVRRELNVLARHASKIQCIFRGYLARLKYQMDLIDIVLVQSVARGWAARCRKAKQKKCIIKIQMAVRVCLAKREVESLHRIQEEMNQKLISMHQSAIRIQKTWRCYTVHVDYMLLILSAITIQTIVRQQQAMVQRKKASRGIILLQAVVRGLIQRRAQLRMTFCATMIQARVRAFIAESHLWRHIFAAVEIQRLARGFLSRIDLDLQCFAAVEIQRVWRGYRRNVEFVVKVIAAIKIQSVIRLAAAKSVVLEIRRDLFLESIELRFEHKKAMMIQRAFRAYVKLQGLIRATCKLQAAFRGVKCRKKLESLRRGIVTLQSAARGRAVRRNRSKKARIISKRLAAANLQAKKNPNMRLGLRTASALVVLQNSTRLAEIMNAVSTLETSTRLSRNCCIAFSECDAPEIIYELVRTCNRSLPHIELLHYVLLTLTNVANHDDLLLRVSTSDSVDVFMDLLQMFRDKENVFCPAVALLYKAIVKNRDLKVSILVA